MGAVEDILDWSDTKLVPWRQDALRRLACQPSFSVTDHDDILNLVKDAVGFPLAAKPKPPVPLDRTHFSSSAVGYQFHLKAIRNVRNVNRLVPLAGLTFAPLGLTVVYGRNGSGKSGFVRILRTACRTRTDNPAKLKVLADVYGSAADTQEAEIIIESNGKETVVPWSTGKAGSEALLQVAVFDSSAAQFYVDAGNEIQFLPFGLALPHKLNDLCLTLKEKLDAERRLVTSQIPLATVDFQYARLTKAQEFYSSLSAYMSDAQIDAATIFTEDDQAHLNELARLLASDKTAAADVKELATFIVELAAECDRVDVAVADAKIQEIRELKRQALEARQAANLNAAALFSGEPLSGIGSEIWRRLWVAARDYSISDAYPGRDFPVLGSATRVASCVLCHQPLSEQASDRLTRFQAFVDGSLATSAEAAEEAVAVALTAIPKFSALQRSDWTSRLGQITTRSAPLAIALSAFRSAVEVRCAEMIAILHGLSTPASSAELPPLGCPAAELKRLAGVLSTEVETIGQAVDASKRTKLSSDLAELEDRKTLSLARDRVVKRRDLLKQESLFAAAESEFVTTGITRKANELVDLHLTKLVLDQFASECEALEITHLKVALARKSGQTKAAFQTNPGTSLTKLASDILSEGEQRALALAAFLTEVVINEGSGPIIIDDPVSSLDRERGLKVAKRISAEAVKRQVVVFTHDLIFFNDLCFEAEQLGVSTETIALFSDGNNAGKIDPAGVIWKGLNVAKRLARIRSAFVPVKKVYATSPADYEVEIKNLYGRLRDTYERVVEEIIFSDVVRRGSDRIETQKLRMVHLSDALAIRFHEGMTKANTHSHDNPEADTVPTPKPDDFEADLISIDRLIADLKSESTSAEAKRPSMKPKKG